jgi:hypothetical protein
VTRFLVRPLAGLLVLAAPAPAALAWGPTGHRAVGRIAERHLTPPAARAVAELLAPETLPYVSTWPDEIRDEPEWAKADDWHWVTVPDGQTYATAQKNPKGDVLEAIARFQKTLGDRTAPRVERVQAVKWLSHLVGDLHMPLHVGGGDDRGGNETLVLWFGEPANLHWVWDAKFIEQSQLSFTELADMLDHAPAEQVREWQRSAPIDWAAESQGLRRQVYTLGDRRLSFKYIHDQWPTVQRRLLQAGIRLAGELNRLLAP